MKELNLIEKVKRQLNFRRGIIVTAFLVYTITSVALIYTLHTKFRVNIFVCLSALIAALALAVLYFWRKRELFKPLRFVEVAQLLDTSLDTKDRIVTLASFESSRNPDRNLNADDNKQAAVAVITSQVTPYLRQFSLAKHLPWRMDYSDRTLLCISPLSLIALIGVYTYSPERPQPMTMAEKQIVRELREMAQDSRTISPVLHSELLDLANSIEQAGLLDSGTEQQIDSTIEVVQSDIQKSESRDSTDESQEGNEKQEQNNDTSSKEKRSESGKQRKSSEENKQSQDNKEDEGKTDDNKSNDSKKNGKEVSTDERKDDQKGDLNPQGKTQEQDRQGSADGSHEQQQKTNKSSTQESQSEQAKKEQKNDPENKDNKQGGSGNDNSSNQDQNSGSEEAEKKQDEKKKPGSDNGATGLGSGNNSENSEQGEPSGDGTSQTAGDQTPKNGKQPKSSQDSSEGGTSAGTDIDGKTPGSFKKEGSDSTAKLKDIKDKLEDIKDSLKNQTPDKQKSGENTGVPDNSDGKADGKTGSKQDNKQGNNKDDKKTDGATKTDSAQTGEKSENQNPDKSAPKSKLSKQDPSKGKGDNQSNDKPESNDANQPSNEGEDDKQELAKTDLTHKREDLAPESQKGVEGEEAKATAANRNTKSDRPLRQPKPSEDAPRYGAGDGESASLSQTKTEVQVGIQNNPQKIAIRGLGSEDKKLYRNPKEAKEKIGIDNQEFSKPKVDYSKQKQPIPVEYQGWLE